jgi:hypothetical protein
MVIDEEDAEALFLRHEYKLLQIIGPITECRPEVYQPCHLLVICRKRNADTG